MIAHELVDGFLRGFRLRYNGPRVLTNCKNQASVLSNKIIVEAKLAKEIQLGRVAGPFNTRPIENLRLSPLGLVPKSQPGEYRLIHNLSYPENNSVNSGIDHSLCSVEYTRFDKAVELVQDLGQGALLAKSDIKSAFRLLPVSPLDFDLLGFTFNDNYYFDKCLPFGCAISCNLFEKFATALEWIVRDRTGDNNLLHYLDDFLFAGKNDSNDCLKLLQSFREICSTLGVPLAEDKTVGPCTVLCFLGFEIDTIEMTIKIPSQKVLDIRVKLFSVLQNRKITLRQMQSLIGSLQFACRAIRPGRAFCRRLISSISGLTKPFHHVTVTKHIKADLRMWLEFFQNFNGVSVFLNRTWDTSQCIELFTDSAGGIGLGFGAYLDAKWISGVWPDEWHATGVTKIISLLEFFPIYVAISVWGNLLANKKIIFRSDNVGVVEILNSLSSKSDLIMQLVRPFVLMCLKHNILFRGEFIAGAVNDIADAISRLQWERFRNLAPGAEKDPYEMPAQLWKVLELKSSD